MDAAKDLSIGFHAVADHPALAVRANRRERVDCALKAVEGVMLASDDYLKRLVIIIFANFACSHTQTVRAPSPLRRCSLSVLRARSLCRRPDVYRKAAHSLQAALLASGGAPMRAVLEFVGRLHVLRSRDSAGK
jgi:hypothetical protein